MREVSKHLVGRCRYSLFVNREGGVMFDTVILRPAQDEFYVNGPAAWIRGIADGHGWQDVLIEDTTIYPLQVQGPRAAELIRRLAGEETAALPYYRLTEARILETPFLISRTGWSGEAGFELYALDNTRADEIWDHILTTGADLDLMVTSSSEMRRVEAGIFNLGTDLTPDLTPYGVGLGRLVDLNRPGDFVGKGALAQAAAFPPKRCLTGIVFDEDPRAEFETLWPVTHDGRTVGRCTVATHSPQLSRHIGFVNVPGEVAPPGTRLEIVAPTGVVMATTHAIPFVDPARKKMRG
jgi:aminomethyltransferase